MPKSHGFCQGIWGCLWVEMSHSFTLHSLFLHPRSHVSLVCDTEALLGGAPITDPFFLAPALYCFDTHNAGE
jgi:hypothetical protein